MAGSRPPGSCEATVATSNLARVLLRHPFMTGKGIAAIYVQALRLRLKRCPFHPHPKHAVEAGITAS